MRNLAEELDRRLVLETIEAHYPHTNYPRNGILVLSRAGIHFYSSAAAEHTVLADASISQGRGMAVDSITIHELKPMGKGNIHYYRPGYRKSSGYGPMGHLIAGAVNLAGRASSKNARATFIEMFQEAQRLAPPLDQSKNPHFARLEYYLKTWALGPAIDTAQQVLECAQLQRLVTSGGYGFIESRKLAKSGYKKNGEQFALLTPQQATFARRIRAWLHIDGERYNDLINQSKTNPSDDAEVILCYGIAYILGGKKKETGFPFLDQAYRREPGNSRTQAGSAWGLALQKRFSEAQQMLANIQYAQHDPQTMLLRGLAETSLNYPVQALNSYLASVTLSSGYIQGIVASQQAMRLAGSIPPANMVEFATRMTQANPNLRTSWEGLALAAERIGNTALLYKARENIAAM